MSKPIFISVILPIYLCEDYIPALYDRLTSTLSQISDQYEIIMVNDASPGNDWTMIQSLANKDPKIKGINFSKNFGQHYAITAGVDYASGDWLVVMDADLEDAPEDILKLLEKAKEGHEIVYGVNKSRGPKSLIYRIQSYLYYFIYDLLAGNATRTSNPSFVLFHRKVAEYYKKIGEKKRHFGPLLQSLGFHPAFIYTQGDKSVRRNSSYTYLKRLKLAITGIVAHSTRLLKISIIFGFIFSALSMAYVLVLVIRKLCGYDVVIGWTSVIASIFLVGGMLMIMNGILGMYIENIIFELKSRPLYVVKDTVNLL